MNKHNDVRAYHSVAALLPDGRVLVGGGGLPGAVGETGLFGAPITDVNQDWARLFGHLSIEIFSPPYLFDANGNPATRPVITTTPSGQRYLRRDDLSWDLRRGTATESESCAASFGDARDQPGSAADLYRSGAGFGRD